MVNTITELVTDKRLSWIAGEWARHANDLAEWAMERIVNRRDVWGQYTLKDGETAVVTLPIKERRGVGSDMVTLNKLRRHFTGRAVSHLIGLHAISDRETCKWFAIDVDLHDETAANSDELALANFAACTAWAARLREDLLDPCLVDSNGVGGYHLMVLLDREYPLADVYDYVANIRSDFERFGLARKPEIFPSKPETHGEQLGSWLRLPGRHHTRPHFSKVWNFDSFDENEWLEGAEAIESLIALRPAQLPVSTTVRTYAKTIVTKAKSTGAKRPRVCVDLDGVLAKYESWRGLDHIGAPIPGALEFANALAQVADIIIFSSRCSLDAGGDTRSRISPGRLKVRVIDWLEKYKFPYADVYVGQGKPRAAAFVDDRAVNCMPQKDPAAFTSALDSVHSILHRVPPAPVSGSGGSGRGNGSGNGTGSGGGRQHKPQGLTFMLGKSAISEIPARDLEETGLKIRDFYFREHNLFYSLPMILKAVSTWLAQHMESISDDMEELLLSPGRSEAQALKSILEEMAGAAELNGAESIAAAAEALPVQTANANIFNGYRPFSAERLAAMISYIVSRGHRIYKTKLNKLLFYSDFVNFHLHGRSVSGATYVHLPFGPVPDGYEKLLDEMISANRVGVSTEEIGKSTADILQAGLAKSKAADLLSPEEIKTVDWVLGAYGKLSTREIVTVSHKEKAYKFTRPNEEIAYAYAKFLEKLPAGAAEIKR
jgi:Protein of unknown function (DUF4065)